MLKSSDQHSRSLSGRARCSGPSRWHPATRVWSCWISQTVRQRPGSPRLSTWSWRHRSRIVAAGGKGLHWEQLLNGSHVAGTQIKRRCRPRDAKSDGSQERIRRFAELLERDGEYGLENSLAALHRLVGGLQRLLFALAWRHLDVKYDENSDHGPHKSA